MWQQEFLWFFTIFHQEFRKNNGVAFETLMVLAVAHLFGFYNPKQLADFLEVPHQQFYTVLKDWSVYQVKKMLLRFMVKQAAEKLKPVMSKSAATRSRAGTTLSIDNRVMDRFGNLLRCTLGCLKVPSRAQFSCPGCGPREPSALNILAN